MKKKNSRRRDVLSKLFKTGFGIGIGANASAEKRSEKVKLLTANGEVIELDKKLIETQGKKSSSSNKDILEWSNNIKT